MERHFSRSDVRSVDAHGVECFSVHDVEFVASIHQYIREPLRADDRVDHEQISPWVRDGIRMVSPVEGYGGL